MILRNLVEVRPWLNTKKTRHILPGATSSETTFNTIQNWMADCLLNHTNCLKPHSPGNDKPLPKRLLELSNGCVVLREDAAHKRHPYACLSHCWGPSPRRPESTILKTKRATLEKFKLKVPWDQLTKTFQDAVEICRRLSINFLWIDSLCILQDSIDDWAQNAAEVGSIYENALLTIAATKSKEGCEGCYTTTDLQYHALSVPGCDNICIRKKPPSYPVHELTLDQSCFPLLDRAWVYQEMHLSVRILHFCSQEVVWACRSARKSESGISDAEATNNFQYSTDLHGWDTSWKDLNPIENSLQNDTRTLWYRIVEEYTRLHISFPSDIFPALAALTQRMYNLRPPQDLFMAGLWKRTLLLDMMWKCPLGQNLGRPPKWRAPTWSWASLQAQVIWDPQLSSIFETIQLLDACCETEGLPEMGNIMVKEGATITLRAPLIKATWLKPWVRSRWPEILTSQVNGKIDVNRFYPDYDHDLPGEYHISWQSVFFLVPIAISWIPLEDNYEGSRDGPGSYRHLGLGLRRITENSIGTSSPAVYERIGYVEIVEEHGEGNLSVQEAQERFERVSAVLRSLPHISLTII